MSDVHELIAGDVEHERVLADFAALFQGTRDVASLLIEYGRFSHAFAGGALALAGRCHLSTDVFDERHAAVVASHVLAAAQDEFGRVTHRDLCHAMMRALGGTPGVSPFFQEICAGYQADDLFHALGFHVASEYAGAREFSIIDGLLRAKYPELVDFLRGADAYAWIELHVDLEREHFAAAAEAIAVVQRSYSGPLSMAERWRRLGDGFRAFFTVLRHFVDDQRDRSASGA